MTEPARPDYSETDAYNKAERCAKVIEDWRGRAIDVNRDWSSLIHDFAWALGLRVKIELEEDVEWQEVEELEDSERGAGGFGHTGVRPL